MRIRKLLLCTIICVLPLLAVAQTMPVKSSFDPLNLNVRLNLPNEITTLTQAVLYVLESTGYRLAIGYPASTDSPYIALRPVPPEAFSGRVMSVADAILLFIGTDNRLLVDPVHKLISFERIPTYNKHSIIRARG